MAALLLAVNAFAADVTVVRVEGQPLAANVQRLLQAFDYLGAPLPDALRTSLTAAATTRDAAKLQELLDPHVLLVAGQPIRASSQSALWAIACIDQLWAPRQQRIAAESPAAETR